MRRFAKRFRGKSKCQRRRLIVRPRQCRSFFKSELRFPALKQPTRMRSFYRQPFKFVVDYENLAALHLVASQWTHCTLTLRLAARHAGDVGARTAVRRAVG